MKEFPPIKMSWIVLVGSGLLILSGLPTFLTGKFDYWLLVHILYGIGVTLFLFDK